MALTWRDRYCPDVGPQHYGCTQPPNHEGDHEARRADGELVAQWPRR